MARLFQGAHGRAGARDRGAVAQHGAGPDCVVGGDSRSNRADDAGSRAQGQIYSSPLLRVWSFISVTGNYFSRAGGVGVRGRSEAVVEFGG